MSIIGTELSASYISGSTKYPDQLAFEILVGDITSFPPSLQNYLGLPNHLRHIIQRFDKRKTFVVLVITLSITLTDKSFP